MKISQTEAARQLTSNKHNHHHLQHVYIPIMFCFLLPFCSGGREENRFMIVNFPPMCFASAVMVLVGCLHRCYSPSDFPLLPSISLAFPARSTRTHNCRLIINPPFVCWAQYFLSPRMIYGFLINFIELFSRYRFIATRTLQMIRHHGRNENKNPIFIKLANGAFL